MPDVTVEFEALDDYGLEIVRTPDPITVSGDATATTHLSNPRPTDGVLSANLSFVRAGTAIVRLNVCDDGGQCVVQSYSYSYAPPPVVTEAQAVPVVSTAPYVGERRNLMLETASLSHTTPYYVSLDQQRAVMLQYSGEAAFPSIFVQLDVTDRSSNPAHAFSLSLYKAGEQLMMWNATKEVFFNGSGKAGDTHRIAGMVDARPLATGIYDLTAVVKSYWVQNGVTTVRTAAPVPLRSIIVNQIKSPYGAGWTIAGAARAHPHTWGVLIEDGAMATWYQKQACWSETAGTVCTYSSPAGDFTTVHSFENGARYTRTLNDGAVETYLNGVLTEVRSLDGRVKRLTYDANRKLTGMIDPIGKVTAIEAGWMYAKITDPTGRVTYCDIDAAGDLIRITGPDGVVALSISYTPHYHWPAEWSVPSGGPWTLAHENLAPVSLTAPEIAIAGGSRVRPKTEFGMTRNVVLARVHEGLTFAGRAARRDPANIWTWVRDPRGHVSSARKDRFGNDIETTSPLGHKQYTLRDANGLPLIVSDQRGAEVRMSWTARGLLKGSYDTTSRASVNLEYEDARFPHLPTIVLENGTWEFRTYDAQGRLTHSRLDSEQAEPTTYTYDALSRLKRVDHTDGAFLEMTYDASEWKNVDTVRRRTTATGTVRTTAFTYDSRGRERTYTDEDGNRTTYDYDLLNRITTTTDHAGRIERVEYGPVFTKYIDVRGLVYESHFNKLGWLEREVNPEQRARMYQYDAGGNVLAATNRRGLTTTFTYDELGRVRTRTADGATTTWTYDNPGGNWLRIENAEAFEEMQFDGSGRTVKQIVRVGGQTYEWTNTYDHAGWRTNVKLNTPWNSSTASWEFPDGKLQRIIGFNGGVTTFDANTNGVAVTTFPGGTAVTTTPNADDLPQAVRYNRGLDAKFGATYEYDAAGRIRVRSSIAGLLSQQTPATWTSRLYQYNAGSAALEAYDDAQHSTRWTCTSSGSTAPQCGYSTSATPTAAVRFTYDAAGNRTDSGAALQIGSNRYNSFRGFTLIYDNDGNTTSKSGNGVTRIFEWNTLGQLKAVVSNGVRTEYGYSGSGMRVRRTSGGTSLYSVYDGDDLFIEEHNGHRREFLMHPGTDRPHSVRHWYQWTQGATHYYATDVAGDVVGLHDANGTAVNTYAYTPFGETSALNETASNPFRFKGREYDAATGLYYVRARWYDPQLARFLSEDPAGVAGGVNLYSFAGDDPVNYRDTSGLAKECISKDPKDLTFDEDRKIRAGTHQLCLEPLHVVAHPFDAILDEWIALGYPTPSITDPSFCPIRELPEMTEAPPEWFTDALQRERDEQCDSASRLHAANVLLHAAMSLGGLRRPMPASPGFSPFIRQGIPWTSPTVVPITGGRQVEGIPPNYTGSTQQMRDIACKMAGRKK